MIIDLWSMWSTEVTVWRDPWYTTVLGAFKIMFYWSTVLAKTCDYPVARGRKNRKKEKCQILVAMAASAKSESEFCQGNEFSIHRKRNGFPVTHCKSTTGNEHSVDILECLKPI